MPAAPLSVFFDNILRQLRNGPLTNESRLQLIIPYVFTVKGFTYDTAVFQNIESQINSRYPGSNFTFRDDDVTRGFTEGLITAARTVIDRLNDETLVKFANVEGSSLSQMSSDPDFSSFLGEVGEELTASNYPFWDRLSVRTYVQKSINGQTDLSTLTPWFNDSIGKEIKDYIKVRAASRDLDVVITPDEPVQEEAVNSIPEPDVPSQTEDQPSSEVETVDIPEVENADVFPEVDIDALGEEGGVVENTIVETETEQKETSEISEPEENNPEPAVTSPIEFDANNEAVVNTNEQSEPEQVEIAEEPSEPETPDSKEQESPSSEERTEEPPVVGGGRFAEQLNRIQQIEDMATKIEGVNLAEEIPEGTKSEVESESVTTEQTADNKTTDIPEEPSSAETTVADVKEQPHDVDMPDEPDNINDNGFVVYQPDDEIETEDNQVKADEPVAASVEMTPEAEPVVKTEPVMESSSTQIVDSNRVTANDISDMLSGFTRESIIDTVYENPASLRWMKQNFRNCLEAVNVNGLALEYVKKPNFFINKAAVKENGLAIQFVKHQTPSLQLDAIKENPSAIYYIKKPTPAALLLAIKENYEALRYNQMPGLAAEDKKPCDPNFVAVMCSKFKSSLNQHICNELVKIDPSNFAHIPSEFKTDRMCKNVVSYAPHNIQHVPLSKQTDKMWDMAIETNPKTIVHNPNPSFELCAKALEYDKDVFDLLPAKVQDQFIKDFGLNKSGDAR